MLLLLIEIQSMKHVFDKWNKTEIKLILDVKLKYKSLKKKKWFRMLMTSVVTYNQNQTH